MKFENLAGFLAKNVTGEWEVRSLTNGECNHHGGAELGQRLLCEHADNRAGHRACRSLQVGLWAICIITHTGTCTEHTGQVSVLLLTDLLALYFQVPVPVPVFYTGTCTSMLIPVLVLQ